MLVGAMFWGMMVGGLAAGVVLANGWPVSLAIATYTIAGTAAMILGLLAVCPLMRMFSRLTRRSPKPDRRLASPRF